MPRGRIVTVPNVLNEVFRDVERQMPVRLLGAGHRVSATSPARTHTRTFRYSATWVSSYWNVMGLMPVCPS